MKFVNYYFEQLKNKTMKTTKIQTGVYKHINKYDETWILRGGTYFDAEFKMWIANCCDSLDECHDDNSACAAFDTKKELINWLNQ